MSRIALCWLVSCCGHFLNGNEGSLNCIEGFISSKLDIACLKMAQMSSFHQTLLKFENPKQIGMEEIRQRIEESKKSLKRLGEEMEASLNEGVSGDLQEAVTTLEKAQGNLVNFIASVDSKSRKGQPVNTQSHEEVTDQLGTKFVFLKVLFGSAPHLPVLLTSLRCFPSAMGLLTFLDDSNAALVVFMDILGRNNAIKQSYIKQIELIGLRISLEGQEELRKLSMKLLQTCMAIGEFSGFSFVSIDDKANRISFSSKTNALEVLPS